MNTDAAWFEELGRGSIAWVVRDSVGSPICFGMKQVLSIWDIQALEALAIWEGLKSLLNLRLEKQVPLIVESDANEIVKSLNDQAVFFE